MQGASGAESKAVCTEAGMFALRERRIHVTQDDFEMAVAKVLKKDSDKVRHTTTAIAELFTARRLQLRAFPVLCILGRADLVCMLTTFRICAGYVGDAVLDLSGRTRDFGRCISCSQIASAVFRLILHTPPAKFQFVTFVASLLIDEACRVSTTARSHSPADMICL
jgi:hypothetical protein